MRRRGEGRPRRGAAGWLSIALLTLASVFVAWQIVQTSAADAFIKTKPVAAVLIAPRDPRVPMTLAMLEFQATGGRVRPQVRQAAIDALAKAPLADEPFFLAGMASLIEGNEAKAERLLAEARRRNPRSRYPRLILLDRYLRAGKIAEATEEMTALSHLIPDASDVLTGELARLASAPETTVPLVRALRRNPALRDRLLEHLVESGGNPELILRLAREVPPSNGGSGGGFEWQAKLIRSMVDRGQVDRAYQLWRSFSSPGAPARKQGLYDAELRGLPGMAPFNWDFPSGGAGAAERSAGGLQVEFYGRDNADLAAQLLTLAPGRYRLSFVADGAADGESSRIGWRLECLQSKAALGELILRNVDSSARRFIGDFTVPAQGCSAQWLRLVGTASEFTKPQNATLRNISLTAVR